MYYLTFEYNTDYIADIDNVFDNTPWFKFKDIYKPIFDHIGYKLLSVRNSSVLPKLVQIQGTLGDTNLDDTSTGVKALMLLASNHNEGKSISVDISVFGTNLLEFLQTHKDMFGEVTFYSNNGVVIRGDYEWERGVDYEYIV